MTDIDVITTTPPPERRDLHDHSREEPTHKCAKCGHRKRIENVHRRRPRYWCPRCETVRPYESL